MRQRHVNIWFHAVFFLSGAAGLVYQVVWSRLLSEVFGVTAHAVTVVLATFLGGLALGSLLLGRLADRSRHPLRLYGLLELGIGAMALAGTWVVRGFGPVHVWAASQFGADSLPLLGIRCALASVVILPPTMMMGGTLPAMTRAFVDDLAHVGRRLGLLYAVNTAGAVVGSVASAFFLIRAVGVHATLWCAVAANAVAGLIAIALAPRGGIAPDGPAPAEARTGASGERWVLLAMAGSGIASLSLEVVWTRMLILVVGTSTYAFATMLTTFLVGIALGSFVARAFVDRLGDPRRAFGWVQVAIAASTIGSVLLARSLIGWAQTSMTAIEIDWVALTAGRFGLSFLVMIVPTTLIGMTLPLAARISTRDVGTVGSDLGLLYGANTAGNIVGAMLGGFVVLPVLGMQRGIAALATLNVAAGAWALLATRAARRRREWWRPGALAAGAAAVVALLTWRPGSLPGTGGGATDPVLYYHEGVVATVKVVQRADDGAQLLMAVDGITIGQSTTGVDRKQQLLAHLPFLLAADHPVRDVLSIGLGTGILVGEVARHPGVRRVECVELSRSVIAGASRFQAFNGGALENPVIRVIHDDGVNYLKRSAARYDAIISDGKSKSGHSGNAMFYSADYYRSAREHLADGGMMVQWVPLDVTPDDLRIIARTFSREFAHVFVWLGPESAFMVGQDRPLRLDAAHVQRVLDAPAAAHLRRHGWIDAADIATLLVADRPALEAWLAGDDTVNTLERPVLEFYSLAGLDESAPARTARNVRALALSGRAGLRDVTIVGGDALAIAADARASAAFTDGYAAMVLGEPGGISQLRRALVTADRGGLIHQWGAITLFDLGRQLDLGGDRLHAIELYREALRSWPEFLEARLNLGRALTLTGWRKDALAEYLAALRLNPESATAHWAAGELLRDQGDVEGALGHLHALVRISPRDAKARDALGLALALAGRPEESLREFREASRLDPGWPLPLERAALVLAALPAATPAEIDEAIALATRAVKLTHPADPMSLETLAAAYAAGGRFQEAVATEREALATARREADPALAAQITATIEHYEHGGRPSLSGGQPPR